MASVAKPLEIHALLNGRALEDEDRMPLAQINGVALFFAHIPKCGGSSIERYMAAKGRLAFRSTTTGGWSKCTPQHMHREIYDRLIPPDAYDHGFVVLRDPKARLISEFKMRAKPVGFTWNPRNWLVLLRNRLNHRTTYAFQVRRARMMWTVFADFDAWVRLILRLQSRRGYLNDNHIRPQVEFLHPDHQVFLFEEGLEPVMRWIDTVTGTAPLKGPFHERESHALDFACSAETEALIRDFYREDYAAIERLRASRGQVASKQRQREQA